jgi:hypothetical protein
VSSTTCPSPHDVTCSISLPALVTFSDLPLGYTHSTLHSSTSSRNDSSFTR